MRHGAAALLAASLLPGCALNEPRYREKPLSAWVEQLADRDPDTQMKAVSALNACGEESVPYLVGALRSRDRFLRDGAVNALGEILKKEEGGGTERQHGLDALVSAMADEDPGIQRRAIYSTGAAAIESGDTELADRLVPLFIGALEDPKGKVRLAAATSLGDLGSQASPAVKPLIRRLSDAEPTVQLEAALALSSVGTEEARAAVPVKLLISGLTADEKSPFSWWQTEKVPRALGTLKERASDAVPALTAALKNDSLQSGAIWALGEIGPAARTAIPALEKVRAANKVGSKNISDDLERVIAEAIQKIQETQTK
jgi:HEAT repeat protein